MHSPDPPLPPLFTKADARAAGMTRRQIDRRLAHGDWERVRRGVMRTCMSGAGEDGVDERAVAAARCTGRDVAISHAHAARVHGLPRPLDGWGAPVLTATSGSTRQRAGARIVVAPLAPGELVGGPLGVPVTSCVRTVVDCLRTLAPHDALAIADAAARRLVAREELVAAVQRLAGWPGIVQARRLADLIDGRRETPLESWSALAFARNDVPMPLWQADIRDASGDFIGRVDGWWIEALAGEADGRAKYALAAAERGGVDAERLAGVLDAERARESRLRRAGAGVVRWGARDVLRPAHGVELARHLCTELRAAGGRNFTGQAAPALVMLPFATGLSAE